MPTDKSSETVRPLLQLSHNGGHEADQSSKQQAPSWGRSNKPLLMADWHEPRARAPTLLE